MQDKKHCYRYVDGNDDYGRPIVMLWERVILRETEKTFWHTDDMPGMSLDRLRKYRNARGGRQVKRCLKDAARSGYHMTKEQAMQAFVYRKTYQLNRITLTAETVELCLKGLLEAGHLAGNDGQISRRAEVLSLPEEKCFVASENPGPVASEYHWGGW